MLGCHKHVTATQAAAVIPDWLFAKWISKCFATKKQLWLAAVTNNPWVVDYTQIYQKALSTRKLFKGL